LPWERIALASRTSKNRGKVKKRTLLMILMMVAASGTGALAGVPGDVDVGSLPPDGGEKYNRLIFEKSPYLLLHAENPIDWYPWCEEAFEKARREDKPVFLSIGYSTCHWCHVMERESFANEAVAKILNRYFVAVKVDREERPDVDQIYMTAAQMMTGRGGWPLTVIVTPDRKPFFAGTYIPREARYGQTGLIDLLERVVTIWDEERDKVHESAGTVAAAIRESVGSEGGEIPGVKIFSSAYAEIEESFDSRYGGFGQAPKFPTPHWYRFLLRYARRQGEDKAVAMTDRSLRALRRGGIFDQIGYGFHRYSTDEQFLVPHFEKMLYDQALLAGAYLEAFQVTGDEMFAETAREIFTYVLRDMRAPDGGFFSAEDADSDGVEGKFYVWSKSEILRVLGSEEGARFADVFLATEGGNYRDEASGDSTGLNILHLDGDPDKSGEIEAARDLLYRHRRHRVPPLKDDKIITSWNGLMIGALAQGGIVLPEEEYTRAAEKAADFVLRHMRDGSGGLFRRYRRGESAHRGYLDDYAFFVSGLLDLYEATFATKYLKEAIRLNVLMTGHFLDEEGGGFTFSGEGNETLLAPVKESYDGALPSGNSVALLNLLRIARLTGDTSLDEMAEELVRSFAGDLRRSLRGHTMMLTALDFLHGPTREIVIVGDRDGVDTKALISEVRKRFVPNKTVLLKPPGEEGEEIASLAPYTREMSMRQGKATVYLCENFTCLAPITDPARLAEELP
jgi:uncharacterized protein YyaL (SSP411 family)